MSDYFVKLGIDLLTDLFGDKSATKAGHQAAESDMAVYQKYLDFFPQYSEAKKTEYKTGEAQTLGNRLAAMGMRGIDTGGSGQPTSSAAAYTQQKSLYDTGYEVLVNQLELEKTKAEGQLEVAKATADATQTGGLFGHGGFLGLGLGG
jgi:hypothetical protein